jgi:tetratricopeptide (TPR) repeat protein
MSEPSPPSFVSETELPSQASMSTDKLSALPPPPAGADGLPQVPGYDLLAVLGRGGMGVVYQARHLKLQRLVALKMVRAAGSADLEDLLRLRTEAEAIARLQHANIVQIFEVGTFQGLPFLALEFCAGGALDKKLAGIPLPPAEAARLVEQLARAMHAAHAKGIVHRDLKPANVLLAEDGTAKIVDFGLAKKLDVAGQTAAGTVMGTPSYMAPEQADGQGRPQGPACDIYALGAILYAAVTGRPPFNAATALDTIMQVVHQEPVPPAQLNPRVPRDLETICLMCLRKEAGKRYATALDLAEDLRRYQLGEPILARPVGRLERLTKWARRRPAVAGLSAALLLATVLLIVGLATGIVLTNDALAQALQAEQAKEVQRQVAEQARIQAQDAATNAKLANEMSQKRLKQFEQANKILTSVFRDINPRFEQRDSLPLKVQLGQRLDRAAKLLEGEAVGDPLVTARLQMTLGDAFLSLGYADRAIVLFTKAQPVLEGKLGPDHHDTLTCLNNLATAYGNDGQYARALALHETVFQKRKILLGADKDETLSSMINLAAAWLYVGRPTEAVQLMEQALEMAKAKYGAGHEITLYTMHALGCACYEDHQLPRALQLLEQTLQKSKDLLGPDHHRTLATMNRLAVALRADRQFAKAVALQEETLQKLQVKLGADHPDTLQAMSDLAAAYRSAGQVSRAVPLLTEVLAKRKVLLRPDHPDTLTAMHNLALAYKASGQLKKALPLYELVVEKQKVQLGPDHPEALLSMNNLAVAYRADGQVQKAIALHEQTLEKRKVRFGAEHPDTLMSMNNLAVAYVSDGQLSSALPLLEQTLQKRQRLLGLDHPDTLDTLDSLAMVCLRLQQYAQAEPLLVLWITRQRSLLPADDLVLARRLALLGHSRIKQNKPAEAEAPLRESLAIYQKRKLQGVASYDAESLLGAALAGQEKYSDAEPLLVGSANGFKTMAAKLSGTDRQLMLAAVQRVIDLYIAWDRPEDAARWRTQLQALNK